MSASMTQSKNNAAAKGGGIHREDLIMRTDFIQTLPELPSAPKFIEIPELGAESITHVGYSTIMNEYKLELFTEVSLGIDVDLIDSAEYYRKDGDSGDIHPTDAFLLQDEKNEKDEISTRHGHVSVPWMRKAEYLGGDFNRLKSANKSKTHRVVEKKQTTRDPYETLDSRIDAIDRTFESIKIAKKEHPYKKGVTMVEESELLPDFDNWKHLFVNMAFDRNPFPNLSDEANNRYINEAYCRGNQDGDGQQFCEFLIPQEDRQDEFEEDLKNGRKHAPGDGIPFVAQKEYNWTVKLYDDESELRNFFFVSREGKVYYNEMSTSVKLVHRPNKGKNGKEIAYKKKNCKVILSEPTEAEDKSMKKRDKYLHFPKFPNDGNESECSGDEGSVKAD
uniref:RNA polymerase II-associated factor 1 homolog n=1 Tax=Rhabditophanes sp. KR3021 TaxID=114890 RepID=A0AC35TJG2_9BILA